MRPVQDGSELGFGVREMTGTESTGERGIAVRNDVDQARENILDRLRRAGLAGVIPFAGPAVRLGAEITAYEGRMKAAGFSRHAARTALMRYTGGPLSLERAIERAEISLHSPAAADFCEAVDRLTGCPGTSMEDVTRIMDAVRAIARTAEEAL